MSNIVKEYNFGRPRPNVFDTQITKERVAKALLSFEPGHAENIWDMYTSLKKQLPADVIPFMIDQFGNFVCFYFDSLAEEAEICFLECRNATNRKCSGYLLKSLFRNFMSYN